MNDSARSVLHHPSLSWAELSSGFRIDRHPSQGDAFMAATFHYSTDNRGSFLNLMVHQRDRMGISLLRMILQIASISCAVLAICAALLVRPLLCDAEGQSRTSLHSGRARRSAA
jgi:hypothetical protein